MTYKPRSRFILSRIKGESFHNHQRRDYIDMLIFLEQSITGKIHGWASNVKLHSLKKQYRKEYHTIMKELDLACYEKLLREEEEALKQEEEDAKKERLENGKRRQEELRWWKECGGTE